MSPQIARRVDGFRRTLIREIFEAAPKTAINLGLGQPDFDPPTVFAEALARAAAEPGSGYGPTAGDLQLRARVASSFGRFVTGPADVVITLGCQSAAFLALGCVVDAGDEVLVPDPGFPGAERAAQAWGARVVGYPLRQENSFRIDVDELMSHVTPRTRAIVVITPSNPTGVVESQATIDRLIEQTAARGLALIIDEVYRELCFSTSSGIAPGVPRDAQHAHVVACGGLSKSVALTGWRVGWVVNSDAAWLDRLVALQQTVLTCPSTPIQKASRIAFEPEGLRAQREVWELFRRRREIVERSLAQFEIERAPLDGAFYAWIRAQRTGNARAVCQRLLSEDNLVVIPGEGFGKAAPDWIRISYCLPEAELSAAIETIARRVASG
jgi:aspartate/methionine/tyrosine aminotransferase